MREIKFRIYYITPRGVQRFDNPAIATLISRVQCYATLMTECTKLNDLFNEEKIHSKYEKHVKVVIVQYTGLKDKNGTEIYEGDRVRRDNEYLGVVSYRENKFIVGNGADLHSSNSSIDEIVGSIYENPELLGD